MSGNYRKGEGAEEFDTESLFSLVLINIQSLWTGVTPHSTLDTWRGTGKLEEKENQLTSVRGTFSESSVRENRGMER